MNFFHLSFQAYFIFNAVLAAGYLFFFGIQKLFSQHLHQQQQLKWVRFSFVAMLISFFIIPVVLSHVSYSSQYQFVPLLKSASITFLQHHELLHEPITQVSEVKTEWPLKDIALVCWLLGAAFFSLRYFFSFSSLYKLTQAAYSLHAIKNIRILFSDAHDISFCWSSFNKHFIVIPSTFMLKKTDLKLALRHESQHVRQGDTRWAQFFTMIHIVCFWNPFVYAWMRWMQNLQEFACDEAIVLRSEKDTHAYADCLMNIAKNVVHQSSSIAEGVIGIHGFSNSILFRRMSMLFTYKKNSGKKKLIWTCYVISFFLSVSIAYALNDSRNNSTLSLEQVRQIVAQTAFDPGFQLNVTPEVVNELNQIRHSAQARTFVLDSMKRMKQYQPIIEDALKKNTMPTELLALPLVESGYQPLEENKNPVQAAGIWQIVPETAKRFHLTVNKNQDDRFNTVLATEAALAYLSTTHEQFKDWSLAIVAYEIGEEKTAKLIQQTHSRDVWILASSPDAPKSLKRMITMFNAIAIVLRHPELLNA